MASSFSRVSAATVAFWITTTIGVVSIGTLVAITIYLGSNETHAGTQIHSLVLASSALNIVCLLCTVAAASLFLLRFHRSVQQLCCISFWLVGLTAAVMTIYSLAWIWNSRDRTTDSHTTTALVQAGFAFWAIATFSQFLLYAIILWPYKSDNSSLPASELSARLQQIKSPTKSLSVKLASLSSRRTSPVDRTSPDPMASHFSSPSLSPRSSFRRSVSQAMRPMTSKTRLLFRTSLISARDSPSIYSVRESSMEGPPRPQHEFRDWDTTGAIGTEDVQPPNDAFIPSTRNTRTRLEPIPGSRPVSPAKPLEGPFLGNNNNNDNNKDTSRSPSPEELPLPDSPMASPALSHPASRSGSLRVSRPRAVSRPHSNHSHQSQESHIHPLFRSESPNPPPVASPGTIITASPYAGQVVDPEHQQYLPTPPRLLRSRPSSPSPLATSSAPTSPIDGRSRQGSCRSVRVKGQASGPASPVEVARSASSLSWKRGGKEG